MKIYITGCARSGTTLLQRLFYSFYDVAVINSEIGFKEFVSMPLSEKVLVAKRLPPAIFSNTLSREEIKEQVELIKKNDIKILNVYRDGRDVIESGWQANCERWVSSIMQMKLLDNFISCKVRYENLVEKPDKVQKGLSHQYGLEMKYKFSEYPDFVPEYAFDEINNALDRQEAPEELKATYKGRRISTDRIGKNGDLYKEICPQNIISSFEKCLGYLSYGV